MNQVVEFIERRFPAEENWLRENNYYFAIILREAFPGGKIFFDPSEEHFLYMLNGQLYDWYGLRDDYPINTHFIDWEEYSKTNTAHCRKIVRDFIK